MNQKSIKNGTISSLQLGTAIGIILFWISFFVFGFDHTIYPSYYTKFEHSFPIPDAFLCSMLFMAFYKRKTNYWLFYTLIASGAMIFLGFCDASFNILNGIYFVGIVDGFLNVFINIWCILFGIFQIRYCHLNYPKNL